MLTVHCKRHRRDGQILVAAGDIVLASNEPDATARHVSSGTHALFVIRRPTAIGPAPPRIEHSNPSAALSGIVIKILREKYNVVQILR